MSVMAMDAATDKSGGKDTNGRVVGVTGPVVDIEFPRGAVPELFHQPEKNATQNADFTFYD